MSSVRRAIVACVSVLVVGACARNANEPNLSQTEGGESAPEANATRQKYVSSETLETRLSALTEVDLATSEEFEEAPRFAWRVPSTARVRARIVKNGIEASTRYWMHVDRADRADTLRIHFSGLEVEDVHAVDPRAEAHVPMFRKVLEAVANSSGTFFVSTSGAFVDLLWEDAFQQTVQAAVASAGEVESSPAEQEKLASMLRKTFETPEVTAMLKAKAAEPWHAWVSNWIGEPLPTPGHKVAFDHPHLGRVALGRFAGRNDGLAEFCYTSDRIQQLPVRQLMGAMVRTIEHDDPDSTNDAESQLDKLPETVPARVYGSVHLVTNLDTLMPSYARIGATKSSRFADQDVVRYEEKVYWFEWQ